jgi:hypothetical protein
MNIQQAYLLINEEHDVLVTALTMNSSNLMVQLKENKRGSRFAF